MDCMKRQGFFLGFGLQYPSITSKSVYPKLTSSYSLQIPLFLWCFSEWHHRLPLSLVRGQSLPLILAIFPPFWGLPKLFLSPITFITLLIPNAFTFVCPLSYFRPCNCLDWIITVSSLLVFRISPFQRTLHLK